MDALRAEIEARERFLENVVHAMGSASKDERGVPRPPTDNCCLLPRGMKEHWIYPTSLHIL